MRDFNHSVGVLVNAYFNGTLDYLNCHACAVGNLIADKKGIQIVDMGRGMLEWSHGNPVWFSGVMCGFVNYSSSRFEEAKEQAESTGYTIDEIAKIEVEFENPSPITDDRMFNGLIAVVDVLEEIHGINLSEKESAKKLFQKVEL